MARQAEYTEKKLKIILFASAVSGPPREPRGEAGGSACSVVKLYFDQHFGYGGEGGIRTHDPVFDRILLFESRAFSRSATSPEPSSDVKR